MIALFNIAMFFLLLVLVYPTVCAMLALVAWIQKRRQCAGKENSACIARIDARIDRLKAKSFKVSLLLLFFAVAPFLTLWLMAHLV